MNRFGIGVGCALLLGAVLQAAPQSADSKAGAETMTLTGCLQKGDAANTFKLTNTAEGAGVVTKTAEAVKPDWELLGAPASLKLEEHVGHKVTVTGTKLSADEAAKIQGEKGTMAKAGEALERNLKVTSIKHVAATCP
jgi:hypothetical protein